MSAVRTYDRETYQRMREAWADFGVEWTAARQACANAGYPFPPSGSRWDDRDDPEPSQRAIVYRALEYRPLHTLDTIRTSRSWSGVVKKILAEEDRLRDDATYRERDAEWDKDGRPSGYEATVSIKRLLDRIGNS